MNDAGKVAGTSQQPPLTADQKTALARLHTVATQLEGVFLQMMMSEMSKSVSKETIFGQQSTGEQIFSSMLDDQRAQQIAQSGSFGIAKAVENQLRDAVLSNAKDEAKAHVPEVEP